MKKLFTTLAATAFLIAAAIPATSSAQPAPSDCGGYGGRACANGAPAGPIGNPAGPVFTPTPAANAFGATGPVSQDQNLPDNGLSWSRRENDGTVSTCRRGLDGTPRCEAQEAARR